MVLGNMAEKHELTAIKTAGVSLMRTLRPLIIFTFFVSVASFYANNNLIPYANLKKYSRLYDLKKSKPTMSLEPGVFNDDFSNIVIYLDDKDADTDKLFGVMIYDHTESSKFSLITADSAEMIMDEQSNQLMMKLYHGYQYQEDSPSGRSSTRFPFVRTSFTTWKRFLDLSEFDVDKTDEDLFKGNQKIMKVHELIRAEDSLKVELASRKTEFQRYIASALYNEQDSLDERRNMLLEDVNSRSITRPIDPEDRILDTINVKYSILNWVQPRKQRLLLNRAMSMSNTLVTHSQNMERTFHYKSERIVKMIATLHGKFSLAFTCLLFLFIGAPMGAIIRKGGFGYPLLIAIIFFVVYIILSTYYRKLGESFQIDAALSAWMPNIILFPIGLFLTIKAMNDSKIFSITLPKWLKFKKK